MCSMGNAAWLGFWVLCTLDVFYRASAVRLVMLDVPSPTIVGESVELTCSYELDGETLYSVKWYKNSVEFYRYVPNDWPPGQFLPMPGIKVDLSKSGKESVFLRHVDLYSAGMYRCEISAEAPEFKTAELEREMKVYVLPMEGPRIYGSQSSYKVGDTVQINCSSAKSKPASILAWYINNEQVDPKHEYIYKTTVYPDTLESSTLGLKFTVTERHFKHGNMKLKCTANISRIYTMSNEALVIGERQAAPLQINLDQGEAQKSTASTIHLFLLQVCCRSLVTIVSGTLLLSSSCTIIKV